MPLKDYRTKRNFRRTPEPVGTTKKTSPVLHFVVQKHRASHLHFDFRLELDGVLKSWATPKGPSMNPEDKRLAMMVEDHPLEYRNFEGIIPKGNYGAGEVIIWDEGAYSSPETSDPALSAKHMRKGLAKGHLSFVLSGTRLKGLFSLVKIDEKNSWLLIKQSDDYASAKPVSRFDTSVRSGRHLNDLTSDDPIRESKPKTFKGEGMSPMLATAINKPFDHPEWLFELKLDGYRAIAEVTSDGIALYSRKQTSFVDSYPNIVVDLSKIKQSIIIDGEIVVLDAAGRSRFQLLQHYNEKPIGSLRYFIFDLLALDGRDLTKLPLLERRKLLSATLPKLEHVQISDYIREQGIAFFDAAILEGAEGVIAKKQNSPYQPGVRSKDWLKIKHLRRQEAVIGGFTEPRGSRKALGALLLGVYEGNDFIYIGHTGGGIDDAELKSLRKMLEPFEQTSSPFKSKPIPNAPVHWVEPHYVCDVQFSEWTNDGSMRQPIFLGLRDDRPPKTVRHEKAEQPETVFKTTLDEKKNINVNKRRLTITNMSKVLWPEHSYTKQDLLDYYRLIAPYILPYLKDRPQSLHRHPHGIHEESFFQKNTTDDMPSWIPRVPVESDSEERVINYSICNDLPSLLYLVNLGCIEINVWNARVPLLDYPDYLVIDLDPGDISFDEVVKAALVSKQLLDAIKVPSFCKTSGKTGLHIYIPIEQRYTHEQVKSFAELLMRFVHKELPDTTSLERSPAKRLDKVYLDFLQNRRGQTMAAPYCLRPVPDATVSTPLLWKEVKLGLSPSKFTIQTIFKRLEKMGDLWQDLFKFKADLKIALDKMARL